jgi:PBP1b-binding outer membrane lipoprotein LpoB
MAFYPETNSQGTLNINYRKNTKVIMKNMAIILLIPLLICSCSQNPATKHKSTKPSTTKTVIEGMTGYTSVKTGRKAADKVKVTSAAHQKDLDEVLGNK